MLAGGLSHEREVSLRSGRRLAAALRGAGVGVHEWDADAGLLDRAARRTGPTPSSIALHGGEGEDGSVQAVLDLLGVPFVGTGPRRPADGVGQADREGRARPRRPRHAGLGRAARTRRSASWAPAPCSTRWSTGSDCR